MIRIAIVEDDANASSILKNHIAKYGEETSEQFSVAVFKDAFSFLEGYSKGYQLIFMDIEMPGIDGLEAAKRLRRMDDNVQLIFVTNMAQYAINGYEVRAMDFILKPVEYPTFFMKMKRAMRYIASNTVRQITIRKDKAIFRLESNKVRYIEVQGHNLQYHTEDGVIETRGNLSEIEESLQGEHFARCNNCYLVNLAAVTKVSGLSLMLGEEELRISRSRHASFMNSLTEYIGGGVS